MKIQVLPPDVNESAANFTPVGTRHPLRSHRDPQRRANVVDGSSRRARRRAASPTSTTSSTRSPALVCNKRVIESLIKAGAFDVMKHKRRALVAVHETAVDQYVDIKRNEAIGQDSLFGGLDATRTAASGSAAIPDIDEWDKMTLLGHERDMLGLYVSDHPLLGLEHVLANGTDCTIGQLLLDEERPDGSHDHRLRPGHLGAAQDHQAGRLLGDGDPRGPRGCDRRAALPQRLPAGQHPPRRGRDHHRQGPALAQQGPAELHGQEVTVPDLSEGPRSRGDLAARRPGARRRSWSSSRTSDPGARRPSSCSGPVALPSNRAPTSSSPPSSRPGRWRPRARLVVKPALVGQVFGQFPYFFDPGRRVPLHRHARRPAAPASCSRC